MSNVKGFTNTQKINEEAAQWILLIEDTPQLSKAQIAALNQWVATSDVHKQCLTEMVNSWGEMGLLASVMNPVEMRSVSNVVKIREWLIAPFIAAVSVLSRLFIEAKRIYKPTVAIPVICFALGVIFLSAIRGHMPISNDRVLFTQVGEQSKHTLEDGSQVWLNSNSQIQIDYSSQRRKINLIKGEAHFEVAKDKQRPFEVYADRRLVRAIGTAFSVYKLEDKIEVLVSEGTVELAVVDDTLLLLPDDLVAAVKNNINDTDIPESTSSSRHLAELTAGQKVTLSTGDDANLNKDISNITDIDTSEVTRSLSWRDGKLVFAGESLEEVVKEISRHSDIRIDVLDPSLKTIRVGGQFKVGETEGLFYVLESGFGINVSEVNKKHVQLQVKNK